MRRAVLALAAAATVTVTACGGGQTATTGSSATPAASATTAATPQATPTAAPTAAPGGATSPSAAARSGYVDYDTYAGDAAAFHNAGEVVLFFNASWCPSCKRTVANLEGDPAAIPTDLTIVSVDYDSAADLKRQYGITYQHTAEQIAGKTV
jgi:thiol-disulfide isomerase/thioredoxin